MEGLNVIFLLNAQPPVRLVLLRRAANKKFAPNMYTGIGGKMEPGETITGAVQRELKEETGLETPLHEFARVWVNDEKVLYYFWGIHRSSSLPLCTEGTLEWVDAHDVLEKDVIPTTRDLLIEWKARNFDTAHSFTIMLRRDDAHDIYSQVTHRDVREGLH